ncbi:MAG: cupredoxin domain-containing protein [Nanoarchaeota archaeon]
MNKILIGVLIVIILVVGGFFLLKDNSTTTGKATDEGVKTFVISASHLRYFMDGVESPELRVKEGDRVRIEFINEEGFHDWKIDKFNASTQKINAGAKETIEFVADKKGTFEYYCSVGKHRANGMKGAFIVE